MFDLDMYVGQTTLVSKFGIVICGRDMYKWWDKWPVIELKWSFFWLLKVYDKFIPSPRKSLKV